MTQSFFIAVIICVIALGVFVYFIFGLNQKPSFESQQTSTLTTSPTAPPVDAKDLKIEDITVGTGQEVKNGDTVLIHYTGTLEDGTKFDSSYDRGEPYETPIGAGVVIKGWDIGVIGMKVGGKRKLTIPASLGYGEQGSGSIPPNATLIFELELMGIK